MFPAVSFLCSYQYNNYYKIGQIESSCRLIQERISGKNQGIPDFFLKSRPEERFSSGSLHSTNWGPSDFTQRGYQRVSPAAKIILINLKLIIRSNMAPVEKPRKKFLSLKRRHLGLCSREIIEKNYLLEKYRNTIKTFFFESVQWNNFFFSFIVRLDSIPSDTTSKLS